VAVSGEGAVVRSFIGNRKIELRVSDGTGQNDC
jgi:hypothetical protein